MEAGGVVKAREEGTGGRGDSGVEVEIRVQLFWCPIFPLKISQKTFIRVDKPQFQKNLVNTYINLYPKSELSERAYMVVWHPY